MQPSVGQRLRAVRECSWRRVPPPGTTRSQHKCNRVECFYSKEHGIERTREAGCSGDADDNSGKRNPNTLPQHQRENTAALRAQRLPDRDLPRALDHRVGDHAVQAEHREQRGRDGECAEQREHQTPLIFGGVEDSGERFDIGDGLIAVHREHLTPYCIGEGGGVSLCSDNEDRGLGRLRGCPAGRRRDHGGMQRARAPDRRGCR
jgi:hypothetical protein